MKQLTSLYVKGSLYVNNKEVALKEALTALEQALTAEIAKKQDILGISAKYNKDTSVVASMADITDAIAGVTQFSYEIVPSLPAQGVVGRIYLVKASAEDAVYSEYLWIGDKFEEFGPKIDLSPYLLASTAASTYETKANVATIKSDLEGAIATKANQADFAAFQTTVSNTYETKTDAATKKSELETAISKKADQTALEGFQTTVSTTYETKADAATKKSDLETAISKKADQTALEGFQTTVADTYQTKEAAAADKSALETEIAKKANTADVAATYETKADAAQMKSDLEDAISTASVHSFTATNPTLTPSDGVVTWVVTHNLDSQAVAVAVFEGTDLVGVEVSVTTANSVTLKWNADAEVSAGSFKVVVIK